MENEAKLQNQVREIRRFIMINIDGFISAVSKQDRAEIRSYFTDDAVINWHCTNECFYNTKDYKLEEVFVIM